MLSFAPIFQFVPSHTTGTLFASLPGAKRALIVPGNKRSLLEVTGDVVEHVDSIFCGDPKTAAFNALGLN
jgi:hypothetical protein